MPTPLDSGFWSMPGSVQGSQSGSSQSSVSGQTFPFQNQFNAPARGQPNQTAQSVLRNYGSYQDYLRDFNLQQNRHMFDVNPLSGGVRRISPGGGAGSYYQGTPFTEEQFLQSMEGRNIGTGQNLQAAAASPALDTFRSRLHEVLASPGSVVNDPGYQFFLNQGYDTLQRQLGSQRMGDSGRALLAAQEYGQGAAQQYLSRLADLYGGGITSEVRAMAPRLGAEEAIFNRYWGGAPYSVSSGSSQSQALGFSG